MALVAQLSALLAFSAVTGIATLRTDGDPAAAPAAQLLALLQCPRSDAEEASVARLVEALSSTPQQKPQLASGRYVACWSSGALAWRAFAPSLAAVRAGQAFNISTKTVENFVDVGSQLRIRANGAFAPASQPACYTATISSGEIQLGSLRLALPIAGEGEFEVIYSDSQLRVFRSTSGSVVQVREDLLA